MRNLKMINL